MADNSVWAQAPERFALTTVYQDVAAVIGWDAAIEFGMKVWETKRPPAQAKTDPIHGGGRGYIYIPAALTSFAGGDLIRLAGRDAAERLVQAFPGLILGFPCIVAASIGRRNKAIALKIADGWDLATVAFGFDLTERQVRGICADQGVSVAAARPAREARRIWRLEGVRAAILAAAATGGDPIDAAYKWGFAPCVAEKILNEECKHGV